MLFNVPWPGEWQLHVSSRIKKFLNDQKNPQCSKQIFFPKKLNKMEIKHTVNQKIIIY